MPDAAQRYNMLSFARYSLYAIPFATSPLTLIPWFFFSPA